jgi:murein DD-endopeptidase MepM/ murein hydrolase activator NlpD
MKAALLILCTLLFIPLPSVGEEIVQLTQGEVFLLPEPVLSPAARVNAATPLPAVTVCDGSACRILMAADVATAPGAYREKISITENGTRRAMDIAVEVVAGDFPEQRLTLPSQYVTPDPKARARIERENRLIRSAYASPDPAPVEGFFFIPVGGNITGRFGGRRVLNGRPSSRHMGVDLRAETGEPVRAAGDGRVALTGDFYLTGKSVFIDHGSGLFSAYFHLSQINANRGDRVPCGAVIGRAGSTGRSLGPHLHFGMRVGTAHVDPLGLIETLQQAQPAGGADKTVRAGSSGQN